MEVVTAMKKTKALAVLHNNSGASLMFVLAVMLLLMAIGTSALVAASAAAGSGLAKEGYNQQKLYADSIQQTIKYSLQIGNDPNPAKGDKDKLVGSTITMGGKLLGQLYPIKGTALPSGVRTFSFTPTLTGVDFSTVGGCVVEIKITPDNCTKVVEVAATGETKDADGNVITPAVPWQPESVIINGTATVTVEVENPHDSSKKLKSVVTYFMSGAYLEQQAEGSTDMKIRDGGEWRFVSHEKINIT